ncbi:regulator of G protein signaling domain-containing protein [Dioszegia hungarica]|uniref:Regulator of G protein signaling domain-containing protein n=1 Tax=Dioszegia hungarica TaxID=4972 RepID=A0AA38HDD1_9TREE|nr:regulator of G protein signaling domain-containing protein [Dioszegia hungarica]KAI9639533.1 regulator of G protein signaling domain-containing protein [Dioszegia hungarica]
MSNSSMSQSHMMKTTRRGRPFVKDTHDLFATLVVSLKLEQHRNFFKTYPNSFTTDEACSNLASLKFSQSNRSADPKDPSRIITTTTTTTFSMTRDMAKGICQHFLESHLIENATDLLATSFKDRGIYMITAKGLHILERFITKNGISGDHLLNIFASQPIAMKLLHLERRLGDDEIMVTRSVLEVLFRRFAGKEPNVAKVSEEELAQQYLQRWYSKPSEKSGGGEELDRGLGVPVRKMIGADKREEFHFTANNAMLWLLDFTTAVGMDEASEMAAQFVRYGLIALVSDKGRVKEGNVIASVRGGGAGGGTGAIMTEGEFRATEKAIYKFTPEGMLAGRWNAPGTNTTSGTPNSSKPNLTSVGSESRVPPVPSPSVRPSHASTHESEDPRASISDSVTTPHAGLDRERDHSKDSHTARLKQILDEPALRSLFREFLRSNFCEENLSFWLDVQDFKRRFSTTSSAVAAPGTGGGDGKGKAQKAQGHAAMDKHQGDLIAMAFVIYNTYLAPASPCELNIDHGLRGELISYMTQVTSDKDAGIKGHIDPIVGNALHASQLQTMVKLYERIQGYIFRLMATDSVPKFVKTDRFLTLARSLFDYNEQNEKELGGIISRATHLSIERGGTIGTLGPEDLLPSPTKAYLTISQAANEKEAALKERRAMGMH